ncbi:preprotein translocase subunit SecY [Oceanirhabdus sp. W0125-5]|uniref:preprotein translocase subunit SecY n=1 Tax=Oceanirhabdus sp. W0125-5 TaxID=2999116 RepID=UPI0022F2FB0E|nr:preprotein translocase subunit SecY [Oceanirhabdus sp. W0125-5]WBW98013.1 preprotein translocase subunit SecY [Oceanirhabdus sp. W0125-5]
MLSTLRNAWKVPELRKRILFTIMMVVIVRLIAHITVPGVDATALAKQIGETGGLMSFYNLFSGGAFSQMSIIALSVTPYINASIIFSLLTVAIPALENLQKEGAEGRKKIQNYTKYASIFFAIVMSIGTIGLINRYGVIKDTSFWTYFTIVVALVTGSVLLVWLGEQITAYGLGNGVSLIIFANIISRLPNQTIGLYGSEQADPVVITLYLAVLIGLLICVVITNMAERRIPVQYAGKAVGNKVTRGQSSHIPVNVNGSAVISIIFAMSVMSFLPTITSLFAADSSFAKFIKESPYSIFNAKSVLYPIVMFLLVIFFCWFYTELQLKPDEMAENMHKSSGFIPGIRPGEPTRKYLETVIGRISIIGGCFAGVIAIFPVIVAMVPGLEAAMFGGTSLLIMTGVALETMKLLESQLVMRHYRGFLK